MSLAEELSRLAELRDRGVLTPKEFDQRKRKLLRGKRPWWMTALLLIIGLFCAICVLAILTAIFVPVFRNSVAANELACDSPEVQQTALNAVNQQINGLRSNFGILGPHLVPPGTQAHAMSGITELHRDKQTGFIACVATAKLGDDEGDIGYTVSWINQSAGEFWVELVHHKDLGDRYGSGPSTSVESTDQLEKKPSARGQEVASNSTEEGTIRLLDSVGSCSVVGADDPDLKATLKKPNGESVDGCWSHGDGIVSVRWGENSRPWEMLTGEFKTAPGYNWH